MRVKLPILLSVAGNSWGIKLTWPHSAVIIAGFVHTFFLQIGAQQATTFEL